MTGTDDQSEAIGFLVSPAAFGGRRPVRRIDTHISVVAVAGERALKLKRSTRNDFLDYSTVARRREACLAELEVNRRTAPEIYLDACPITRGADGALRLGGEGEALDWVVVMLRFDEEGLFSRLAERGALTLDLIDRAADAVARLHDIAERTPEHGGETDMRWIVEGNLEALQALAGGVFGAARVERLADLTREALDRHREPIEERRGQGFTRRCHGDLHLGNICLLDGRPTLFDAIEFNDRIACCDVLYDLAFLVMDLWSRGDRAHANRVLNRYLWRTGDYGGLALLPFFLSCRAAVRAKTSAWAAATQEESDAARGLEEDAAAYLDLALAALDRPAPCLVAIGGLSGTGKTTLAMRTAPDLPGVPGAIVLRSDVLRKQCAGAAFEERLPKSAYGSGATRKIYRRIASLAAELLDAGLSVVADAVYARETQRRAIEAAASGASFRGLWLEAPLATLEARLDGRRGDASDADRRVVRGQARYDTGTIAWHRIDASGDAEAVARRARDALDAP